MLFRSEWNPRNQRPELWKIFNGRKKEGEHFRVFPISNWTELDVWLYIQHEQLPLPSLYFAHNRKVFFRGGSWYADEGILKLKANEKPEERRVRFRTIGDITCTGAMESEATTVAEIIHELRTLRITERGFRIDDKRSEAAMEDRKKTGYF